MEQHQPPANGIHICPLCGVTLLPRQIVATLTYLGSTYAFCSDDCHEHFRRQPEVCLSGLAHADDPHLAYPCPRRKK